MSPDTMTRYSSLKTIASQESLKSKEDCRSALDHILGHSEVRRFCTIRASRTMVRGGGSQSSEKDVFKTETSPKNLEACFEAAFDQSSRLSENSIVTGRHSTRKVGRRNFEPEESRMSMVLSNFRTIEVVIRFTKKQKKTQRGYNLW